MAIEERSAAPRSEASTGKKSSGQGNRRRGANAVVRYLRLLGPGLITGASDDDPSGIGTYLIAGAQLGDALDGAGHFSLDGSGPTYLRTHRIGHEKRDRNGPSRTFSAEIALRGHRGARDRQYDQRRRRYSGDRRRCEFDCSDTDQCGARADRHTHRGAANLGIVPLDRECFQMALSVALRLHRGRSDGQARLDCRARAYVRSDDSLRQQVPRNARGHSRHDHFAVPLLLASEPRSGGAYRARSKMAVAAAPHKRPGTDECCLGCQFGNAALESSDVLHHSGRGDHASSRGSTWKSIPRPKPPKPCDRSPATERRC